MSFDSLGLLPELLRAISDQGYTEPSPIQQKAIPPVLAHQDIMGCAQTGTGKTAGFALPILQILAPHQNTSPSPARHSIRALILTPTRELAAQVEESVRNYGKYLSLRSTVVYGGVDINPQIKALREGVEILVATPGRLLDHVQQKTVNLSRVEILVLDEADRMLDMGFMPDIKRIIAMLPAKRQNLLFSATFSDEIKRLANQILRSGTAGAPNYAEARGAESRADFIHKMRIVQKELNETAVWIRIMAKSSLISPELLVDILAENKELCRIASASIKTARTHAAASPFG